jgi:hypothetical protein
VQELCEYLQLQLQWGRQAPQVTRMSTVCLYRAEPYTRTRAPRANASAGLPGTELERTGPPTRNRMGKWRSPPGLSHKHMPHVFFDPLPSYGISNFSSSFGSWCLHDHQTSSLQLRMHLSRKTSEILSTSHRFCCRFRRFVNQYWYWKGRQFVNL